MICNKCGKIYPMAKQETINNKILTIYDVYYDPNLGTVVTGVIVNGTIKPNEIVTINNRQYEINAIEYEYKLLDSATEGMDVGILFREAVENELNKGDIIYKYISDDTWL